MFPLDTCSLKKSLPILIALLVVAQIDLASAAGWPGALLSLLHLTPRRTTCAEAFARASARPSTCSSSISSPASGPGAHSVPDRDPAARAGTPRPSILTL